MRLTDDVDVSRGDLHRAAGDPVPLRQEVTALACWLGDEPAAPGRPAARQARLAHGARRGPLDRRPARPRRPAPGAHRPAGPERHRPGHGALRVARFPSSPTRPPAGAAPSCSSTPTTVAPSPPSWRTPWLPESTRGDPAGRPRPHRAPRARRGWRPGRRRRDACTGRRGRRRARGRRPGSARSSRSWRCRAGSRGAPATTPGRPTSPTPGSWSSARVTRRRRPRARRRAGRPGLVPGCRTARRRHGRPADDGSGSRRPTARSRSRATPPVTRCSRPASRRPSTACSPAAPLDLRRRPPDTAPAGSLSSAAGRAPTGCSPAAPASCWPRPTSWCSTGWPRARSSSGCPRPCASSTSARPPAGTPWPRRRSTTCSSRRRSPVGPSSGSRVATPTSSGAVGRSGWRARRTASASRSCPA